MKSYWHNRNVPVLICRSKDLHIKWFVIYVNVKIQMYYIFLFLEFSDRNIWFSFFKRVSNYDYNWTYNIQKSV